MTGISINNNTRDKVVDAIYKADDYISVTQIAKRLKIKPNTLGLMLSPLVGKEYQGKKLERSKRLSPYFCAATGKTEQRQQVCFRYA